MNDPVASASHSRESRRTKACGVAAYDSEHGMGIPPRIALAIRQEQRRLGVARSLLMYLPGAAIYGEKFEASSAGVAEVVCRLIEETTSQIEVVELCRTDEKDEAAGPIP